MFAQCKITFLAVIQITIYVKLFENVIPNSPKIVFIPSSVVHFFIYLVLYPNMSLRFRQNAVTWWLA
jgi:hypothetical protein